MSVPSPADVAPPHRPRRGPPAPIARPPLSREELRDVLVIALRAGQIMLENGANTLRVEETVHRIGTGLGAEWLEVYVTPGGILVTGVSHGEHRTRIQRVVKSGIDLSRVAAVIGVSRAVSAGEMTRDDARTELDRIATQPRVYGQWSTMAGVGLACGTAALLFGGGPTEGLIALGTAAVAQFARVRLAEQLPSRILVTGLIAALATALAYGLVTLVPSQHSPAALLASVLLLVPGVLMVSSIADLFRGDTVSGVARGVNAVLVLGAIGAGIWGVLLATGAQLTLAPGTPPVLPLAMLLAACNSIGFGILFDVPRRALLAGAIVGMLAYSTRYVSLQFAIPPEAAIFFGGLVIGLLGELLARWRRLPTAMFTIPAFVTLVPGTIAFRALLDFVRADYTAGTEHLVQALLLTAALAAGIGVVNAIARMRTRPVL